MPPLRRSPPPFPRRDPCATPARRPHSSRSAPRRPYDGKRRSSSSPAAHPSLARGPRRRSPSPVAQQLSPAAAVLRPTAGWSLHRVATYPAYPQHHAGSRPPLVSPPLPSRPRRHPRSPHQASHGDGEAAPLRHGPLLLSSSAPTGWLLGSRTAMELGYTAPPRALQLRCYS